MTLDNGHSSSVSLVLYMYYIIPVLCQNLGAANSNRVRTRQDTMDVDSVLGNNREERK